MKMSLAVVFLFVVLYAEGSFGMGMKKHVKDLHRTEILQEILRRFFLTKDGDGIVRVTKDLGFLAYARSRLTTSSSQVIKFNGVDRNDRNGYSTSTGMFVAPVSGLYHFFWNILSLNGKRTSINLKVNGNEKLGSFIHAQQTYERPGGSVYLRLQKGDKVYLEASDSGGVINEGRYSTFGGELIRY